MELGATFSHRHLNYLGLNHLRALAEFKSLGLKWIRLGCYWNLMEPLPGRYYFDTLDRIVEICTKENLKIILSVGMKAPRYPEFYFPDWIVKKTGFRKDSTIGKEGDSIISPVIQFVRKCVTHYKNFPAVKIWQVENEPLDPSGDNNWNISPQLLKKEIESVNKIDTVRKILVNLWGNEAKQRGYYKDIVKLADIVGLDIYPRRPVNTVIKLHHRYSGPGDSYIDTVHIAEEVKSGGKKFWLTELQAEPWESGEIVTAKSNPPSFMPGDLIKNLVYGKTFNPSVILLWGFEWWYYRKQKGDLRYWREAERLKSVI